MANEMEVGVATLAVVSVGEKGQGEILVSSLSQGFRQVELNLESELATLQDNLRHSSEIDPHDKVTQRGYDLESRDSVRRQLKVAKNANEWLVGTRALLAPDTIAPGAIVELTKDGQRLLFLVYSELKMPGLDTLIAEQQLQKIVGCELACLEIGSGFYLLLTDKLSGDTIAVGDDPGWVVNIL